MKTLGEFYKARVLSQKNLKTIELPSNSDDIRIVQDLFGWRLRSGKEVIDCRSEAEARYLKVFLDAGMRELCVPEDDEYLNSIVPELEAIKTRLDRILNEFLETILNRKDRAWLKREVFIEMTKSCPYAEGEYTLAVTKRGEIKWKKQGSSTTKKEKPLQSISQ